MDGDDYLYLPIFKKLEEGSHMHLGNSMEIDINENSKYPKIVYVGYIFIESKK